jgi:hypothetical protein
LSLIREQHAHRRRLRSGEDEPQLAVVVLQLRAQHRCPLVDVGDAGELIEDDDQRVLLRGADEDVEERSHGEHGIGPVTAALGKLDTDEAEPDRQGAGERVDRPAQPALDPRQSLVDRPGEVGHGRQLVQVDPYRVRAHLGEVRADAS